MNCETQKNISKYIKSFSPNRYKKKSDDDQYLSHFNNTFKATKEKVLIEKNNRKFSKFMIEIGCGCGDFLTNYASNNKDTFCIGCDAYTGGIIITTRKIVEQKLSNVNLLNYDAREFLDKIDDCFWDDIFVLFPDPWPKKRHHKRRLLTKNYILELLSKIKNGGSLTLGTDDESYQDFIKDQLEEIDHIIKTNEEVLDIISFYKPTKYHTKANLAKRNSLFFKIIKK